MDNSDTIKPPKTKKRPYRWLRRLLRSATGVFIFLVLLILFIRSPWGQSIIVDKLVNYVSEKTQTTFEIQKLFITFDGGVQLEGLYLEDKMGDTLVYSKSLQANIPLWKTITGEAVGIDDLEWNGLHAKITRQDTISGFNFQFLVDAFAAEENDIQKDTGSKPVNLVLGELNLSDIHIKYFDMVSGIDSNFKIGQFKTELKTIDLESMQFDAKSIELSDANVKFYQMAVAESEDSSTTTLPKLSVEKLSLNRVQADFQSDDINANINLVDFYTEIPKLDLADKQYVLSAFQLKNSDVEINMKPEGVSNKTNDHKVTENLLFEWPDVEVEVAALNLENNNFIYTVNNEKPIKNRFNPNALWFQNLTLDTDDVVLNKSRVGLQINTFSFDEYSGYQLKEFSGHLNINDEQLSFEDLILKLNENSIDGFAKLNYSSIQSLIDKPENASIQTVISSFNLSLKDLFTLQPELKKNPYLKTLSQKQLKGNLSLNGTLNKLNIPSFKMNWGRTTQITARASIQNASKPELIQFNAPNFSVKTNRADVLKFVSQDDLGVTLPEMLSLTGKLNGTPNNISADAKFTSTQGIVSLKGNFRNKKTLEYDAYLVVEDYKLDELLSKPQLGSLSLEFTSKGSGSDMSGLNANIDGTVSKFDYNTYRFSNLVVKGDIRNGEGSIQTQYLDDNLNLNLNTIVNLDSTSVDIKADLDLKGANLQALGLMQREVKTGFNLSLDFSMENEVYKAHAKMNDGAVVYNNENYLVGSLNATAYLSKDTTSIEVNNRMVDLKLKSNTDPQSFINSLNNHIKSYLIEDFKNIDSLQKLVNVSLRGTIAQSPLLNEVFLVNVKDLDTINMSLDFDEKQRTLDAFVNAPHINFAGNEIDSLKFNLKTDDKQFNFDFGFNKIKTGPFDVPQTIITGSQQNNELSLIFKAVNNGKHLIYASSKIKQNQNSLRYSLETDSLIINTKRWEVPETNAAIYRNDTLVFEDFEIKRNDQSIRITDQSTGIDKSHIAFDFKNFKLSQLLNYLNPDTEIAKGKIDGKLIIENPFTNTGIIANIDVSQIEFLKANLGTLSLDANSNEDDNYVFNARLKDGDIDFNLNGNYTASDSLPKLNLDFNIAEFKMKALNQLSLGEVKEGSGSFSGQFKLNGTTSNPKYNGRLNFKNAGFNITKLNTNFLLKDEILTFDNEGFSMQNFTLRDAINNQLTVSGKIGTKSFINPTFDLKLKAKDFKVLDAKKGDNDLFYGKAIFDADATLTGDLQIPKLDSKIEVDSKTDFVYILPPSKASIQKREGVVTFVNRENPDAILSNNEVQTASITGFDIKSLIKISEEAKFQIIIDEDTGDNFQVQGKGNLNFQMFPNGRINLSGLYEITDGLYKLSLYNLVKREFQIASGSKVVWNGDPFNAELDVRAIYNVEASASSLMAAQITGLDPSTKSKFRQDLPFEVYLNIDGQLLQPEISFELDMPEEERSAIGGQVYSRVLQVNQQEAELNQQVFSLLVLNRFYPSPGSDGSSGGIQTLAQENLNDAISEQLNAYSDKILGNSGVELDFGLDSYTDYQRDSPTQRTQLNVAAKKKLFNERLTIRVGSDIDVQASNPTGESTPILGNVSLVYELTKDGRYKLKGFTKNNFENVIDGQTIVSGIALIFTQEFNKFDELWKAIFRKSKAEVESEKTVEDENSKAAQDNNEDGNKTENN